MKYLELRFDPDQPRGKDGKWIAVGGGGSASVSKSYGIPKKPTLTLRLTSKKKSGKIKSSSSENIKPSVGGGTIDIRKCKTGRNKDSKGNLYIPYDQKGNAFGKPEYHLPPKTYKKIVGEINTEYDSKHKGKKLSYHRSANKVYYFENHGYDDFNIYDVGD